MVLQHCTRLLLNLPLLGWRLLCAIPAAGWRQMFKRTLLFVLLYLVFILLNLLHIAGFLLDEVLFAGWHKTTVQKPLFIVGLPRSGTSFLQRVLALDPQFTTLTTWEALLAPSITERYVYTFIGKVLGLFGTIRRMLRKWLLSDMDSIHRIRLNEPEEDFLLLLPLQGCLLLAFAAPDCHAYWNLARFDHAVDQGQRSRLLAYYRFCLQKHLYYHGADKTVLSKNPSFTSWLGSLEQIFPDARFVACLREPEAVVPSQLSALRPAMRLLGDGTLPARMQTELLGLLHHYYAVVAAHRTRLLSFNMTAIQHDTAATCTAIFAHCRMQADPGMQARLDELAAKPWQSKHRYSSAEFGLQPLELQDIFADVWPLPDPGTDQKQESS